MMTNEKPLPNVTALNCRRFRFRSCPTLTAATCGPITAATAITSLTGNGCSNYRSSSSSSSRGRRCLGAVLIPIRTHRRSPQQRTQKPDNSANLRVFRWKFAVKKIGRKMSRKLGCRINRSRPTTTVDNPG